MFVSMFSVSVSRILELKYMRMCGLGWAAPHSHFFPSSSYLYLLRVKMCTILVFFVVAFFLHSLSNIFHFTLFLCWTLLMSVRVCVCVPFYFCRLFALSCSCCFGIVNSKRKPANASLCFSLTLSSFCFFFVFFFCFC